MNDFKVKLKEKVEFESGATRDSSIGKGRFDLIPDFATERVAKVYEGGGINHGDRNWEKGMFFSRLIDSALRHIIQYKMSRYDEKLKEEDHLAHAVWNINAIMHFEKMIELKLLPEELDNLPKPEK